jgi:hypothetical protein
VGIRLLEHDLRQPVLVGVANYLTHTGQCCNLLGRTLGVTPGDHDLTVRILTTNAADGGSGVAIGGSGDRAGVQHDDFGFGCMISAQQSALTELALDRGAVRLGGAATEVFYIKAGHGFLKMGAQRRPWMQFFYSNPDRVAA